MTAESTDEPVPEPPAPQQTEAAIPAPAAPAEPPRIPPPANREAPGVLPSFRLDDNPIPAAKRGQKLQLPHVPEINLASAIEAFLQHRLAETGDFTGRSIHVYPAPDGSISIEVDGEYFDAVSDVRDAAVRAYLQATIQEWQDRH